MAHPVRQLDDVTEELDEDVTGARSRVTIGRQEHHVGPGVGEEMGNLIARVDVERAAEDYPAGAGSVKGSPNKVSGGGTADEGGHAGADQFLPDRQFPEDVDTV